MIIHCLETKVQNTIYIIDDKTIREKSVVMKLFRNKIYQFKIGNCGWLLAK
jgi:hypothetical protein